LASGRQVPTLSARTAPIQAGGSSPSVERAAGIEVRPQGVSEAAPASNRWWFALPVVAATVIVALARRRKNAGRQAWYSMVTIRMRMGLAFGVVSLLFGAALLWMMFALSSSLEQVEQRAAHDETLLMHYNTLYSGGLQTGQATRNVILNPADVKAMTNFEAAATEIERALDQSIAVLDAAEQKQAGNREALERLRTTWQEDLRLQREAQALAVAGKVREAINAIAEKETPIWRQIKKEVFAIRDMQERGMEQDLQTMRSATSRDNLMAGVAGIGVVLLALTTGVVLARSITHPLRNGAHALEVMATGDLTVRMQGEYPGDLRLIKESINTVGSSLEAALHSVGEAVSATASASNQISASTEQMAAGAQEQTTQANDVAGAVEEMMLSIQENSRNARVAAGTAEQARIDAEEGGKIVNDTVDGMHRIAAVVKQSAETVRDLGRSSDQIGEIIGVIEEIADQTNLLALNAAIEAARAGDQGRGFAVVADEVRKLAERTTRATKEITGMIKKIQSDTTGAVRSMEQGTAEVERGIALADKAGVSLREIVHGSHQVTGMVAAIASVSEKQSETSETIMRNVEGISKVTGETAQGTSQIARAAEDLNRLTEDLQRLVARFRTGEASTGNPREGRGSQVAVTRSGFLAEA
jgi:methyl-accepting chemotaxis protein